MLAKRIRIFLQHFWLFGLHCNQWKLKANPGSGRTWNLEFRGGHSQSSKKFFQRVYSRALAVDSDCSRTAPGHCYGSSEQFQ